MRLKSSYVCKDFSVVHTVTSLAIPLHAHPTYVMGYYFRGSSGCRIGLIPRIEFKPGDISLLNPGEFHEDFVSQSERDYLSVSISKEFFKNLLTELENDSREMPHFLSAKASGDPKMRRTCEALKAEVDSQGFGREVVLHSLVTEAAIRLMRRFTPLGFRPEVLKIGRPVAYWRIRRALDYLRDNYKEEFSLCRLSEIAGLSKYYLDRAFKRATGYPPYAYITLLRIERAKQLLSTTHMPIVEIALEVGFSDQSHFTNAFKRFTGVTPISVYLRIAYSRTFPICCGHMKQSPALFEELDDWGVLCSFLPEGWEQKARDCGALTRARGVSGPDVLLRVLLIHIANGCSLAETAVRARQMGLAQLNQSAVYKRLRSAEEWLRWLSEQMRASLGMVTPQVGQRLRVVDATSISEPGSTGTDWRIHYAIDLTNLQCDFFLLTDVSGGETWRRFPVGRGDIMLGDRGYANPPGVRHVVNGGADLLVRLNRQALPLFGESGERLDVVTLARKLKPAESTEWAAWVHCAPDPAIKGRLIVVRRSKQATEYARKKLKQQAIKKQRNVSPQALEAAPYFFMWTTLPSSLSRQTVLELYRSRWQIELAFRRMKSIMGLGHLPKRDPESCRAWLHGKLFTSLLVERMIGAAKNISPWGYELGEAKEPVA